MNNPQAIAHFPAIERLAQACARDAAFRDNFATEEACRRWFFHARWPGGFECPICRGRGRRVRSRGVFECVKCRHQTSLTAGTLLHGTRKPLKTWFEAAYLVVQRGVNARTLQRELGLTYKVAWTWGHKLRAAMKAHVVPEKPGPKEDMVLGASRTRTGCLEPPNPKRPGPCGCTKLLRRDWGFPDEMAEEREVTRLERLRLRGILLPEPTIPEDYPPNGSPYPGWDLLATFQGSLSEKHFPCYLDEYAFRENRKKRPLREAMETLLRSAATRQPLTYKKIVARPSPGGHRLGIFRTTAHAKRA